MGELTGAGAFANRYRARDPLNGVKAEAVERFLNSAAHVVSDELLAPLISGYEIVRFDTINGVIDTAHRETCMDLGRPSLFAYRRAGFSAAQPDQTDSCCNYLVNVRQPAAERISFLENLLACAARQRPQGWPRIEKRIEDFLRPNAIPLEYRGRVFSPLDARVFEEQIHEPFWELLEDPIWGNVRTDMQTAFSQRDNGGPDPAFYAARALESAIKVVVKLKGWTRGKESGASSFIDNLVSQANGRFIDVWEADVLKSFFGKVRNPTAHGAGDGEQPKLNVHQTSWALEFCMIWVKSLIKRM